jgi:antitoxin ParD1/3/4
MDQMNVSVTDHLAEFVRKKVKAGRYNNVSEVVRDALRRMEEEEERALRLGKPSAEDVYADLTETQLERIRARVRTGISDIDEGRFTVYEGSRGLDDLARSVKEYGQRMLGKVPPER